MAGFPVNFARQIFAEQESCQGPVEFRFAELGVPPAQAGKRHHLCGGV
jgi:hypothetical protein